MKQFFEPTKGGRRQRRQGLPPQVPPTTGGMGGTGGKGETRHRGNLMQPQELPLAQPPAGEFGAGVGRGQFPQL